MCGLWKQLILSFIQSKPLTIRQAALSAALDDGHASSRSPSPQPLTHIDEQSLLQSETRAAFHGAIDSLNNGIFVSLDRIYSY